MNLLSRCLLRTRSRRVLLVLAFFGVMVPCRARADGAEGGAGAPDPSSCTTSSPHRLQLTAGTHWMVAARSDYGESVAFTPSLQAAYLYRAFRYLELGAGLSGYLWTETYGGPIFLPYVTGRVFVPFTSSNEAVELGVSIRMGASIGYYHADIRNEPDHHTIHTGFGLVLGPDVRIPVHRSTSLHFSLELGGLGTEKPNINYYSPLANLGGALGIVTAL